MDETVDRATYCNHFISELLYDKPNGRAGRALKQLQCTDCKSLYDVVIQENPSTTEKRTMIAIRSVQDFLSEDDCRWVPTTLMRADVLTKKDKALCLSFHEWLESPYVMLTDESKNTSVKICVLSASDL